MPDPAAGGETLRTVDQLLAQMDDLRRSHRRAVEAADDDRQALERTLHDGVQQHLIALAVDLQRLQALLHVDPASATSVVIELREIVRLAIAEAAALAHRIYPPILGTHGLATALRRAADDAGITARVAVDVTGTSSPRILATVYWCWLEAAAAAPPASHAEVDVRSGDAGLTFAIVVAGQVPDERLDGVRDRVAAFGGSVEVRDLDDGGTGVHGTLPPSG